MARPCEEVGGRPLLRQQVLAGHRVLIASQGIVQKVVCFVDFAIMIRHNANQHTLRFDTAIVEEICILDGGQMVTRCFRVVKPKPFQMAKD